MDVSARPPLRLSVEERVEHAVSSAVRRALAEQRKTQEEELDALSDVVQRSLAALAGERDRALRSLAAEEDRRRDMVEDLSGLLGAELSCGDVSRLAMGLERIEREGGEEEGPTATAGGEEGGEPKGRAWVLEQLRQCLHARAAAQDHLRSSADEIAADLFEAEEGFMGFELGPGGGRDADGASPISCPPPPSYADEAVGGVGGGGGGRGGALWSARSEGVAQARAAATGALDTSLRLARARVEKLEALVREVKGGKRSKEVIGAAAAAAAGGGGGGGGGASAAAGLAHSRNARGGGGRGISGTTEPGTIIVDEGLRPARSAEGAAAGAGVAEAAGSDDADGFADEAAEAGGRGASSSDGSWSFLSAEQEGSVGAARDTEPTTRRPAAAAAAAAAADGSGAVDGNGDGAVETLAAAAAAAEGTAGGAGKRGRRGQLSREQDSAAQGSSGSADGNLGGRNVDVDESRRHRTALGSGAGGRDEDARGGTAAQALRRGVPAVAGSGEAERWRMAALRSEAALADLRETLGDVLALSFRCGEESAWNKNSEGKEKEEEEDCHEEGGWRQLCAGGGGGDEAPGTLTGEGGVGDDAAAAAAGSGGSEARGGGSRGAGTCCGGRRRCRLCEAKSSAVGVLLRRLEALSADQGQDVARLEASLKLLPGAASPSVTASAAAAAAAGDDSSSSAVPGSKTGGQDKGCGEGEKEERDAVSQAEAAAVDTDFEPEEEGAEERGASLEGDLEKRGTRLRDASPERDIRTEWEEVDELDTYLAHYQGGGGLGSQAVQGVLDRWIDVSKRHILEGWLGHVLHGGPVDAANGSFVPRVQMSSLSKEVRDGMVSVVLPLLLGRRGVLLQVLTRERVEIVHDIQIRVTSVAGRREQQALSSSRSSVANVAGRRRRPQGQGPVGEREHGARIRDMVMKAAHVGFVDEEGDGRGGDGGAAAVWRAPLSSVDSLSRQLKDTWENFNANFTAMGDRASGSGEGVPAGHLMLPEY